MPLQQFYLREALLCRHSERHSFWYNCIMLYESREISDSTRKTWPRVRALHEDYKGILGAISQVEAAWNLVKA